MKKTPLADLHEKLGARLAEFAGWEMPIQYKGIVAEHNAVRKRTLSSTRQALTNGAPLSVALNDASLLDAAGFAIVSTSESAGRLDDGLQRVAANDHDDLDGRYSMIAQWLPVFVYVCVTGVVLAGLLG